MNLSKSRFLNYERYKVTLLHVFLLFLVVVLWAANYVIAPIGLETIPPLLLTCLRLFFVSVPAIFFVPRLSVPFPLILGYGWTMFALQFAFLFSGIETGVSVSLAPLILQSQIFFTSGFAYFFLKEPLYFRQILGGLVAFSGVIVAGVSQKGEMSPLGFSYLVLAAISWGAGNVFAKKIGPTHTLSLVVWGSFVSWPPLLALSLFFEKFQGWEKILAHLTPFSFVSLGYLTYFSLLLAYWIWSRLICLYPLAKIVPFTLLVPILGSLSSSFFFSLPFSFVQMGSLFLVVLGLSIDMLGRRST